MIHILESMRFFNATDARDHVYGTLGILEKFLGTVPEMLAPNYQISYVDVFHRAALAAIEHDQVLALLGLAGHRTGKPKDTLPSWVPRFNSPIDKLHDPNPLRPLGTFAHGGVPLKVHNTADDNAQYRLVVSGIVLADTIAHILPAPFQYDGPGTFLRFLIASRVVTASVCPTDEETIDDALSITLQAGVKLNGTLADSITSNAGMLDFERILREQLRFPRDGTHYDERESSAAQYYRAMINACYHRSFFATRDGRIGLGPKTIEQGDVVAVLFGATFPVILRPVNNHNGEHELVGVAYVHGMMAGEAVREHRAAGTPDDVIRLR